jgi:prolipoprotein diacylglyceryltransferase
MLYDLGRSSSLYSTTLSSRYNAAHSVAAWFRTRRGVDPGPVLWKMIVFGFLAGRSIFVLRHHEIYSNAPLSIIDFRDGGFDNLAGFATAVWLAWNCHGARRHYVGRF